jgi:hypothetical protein
MKTNYILYHGSREVVTTPLLDKGKPNNDYGRGFYCTESVELAREWACTKTDDGYVNKYSLDTSALSVLHLSGNGYNILNWMTLLLKNRSFVISNPLAVQAKEYLINNFSPDTSAADVIIGYRADDSYFSFAEDFINNTISLKQLARAMYLGRLGEQVVLMSVKGFNAIQFIESEQVARVEYYPKRQARDDAARKEYVTAGRNAADNTINDIFVLDILRGEIKNDDPRIQRSLSK